MKPFRAILATTVLAGVLTVMPTQFAAACGFSSGFDDCPVSTLYKSGKHNFGIKPMPRQDPQPQQQDLGFLDPAKYAQAPSAEQVQRNKFWFGVQESREDAGWAGWTDSPSILAPTSQPDSGGSYWSGFGKPGWEPK